MQPALRRAEISSEDTQRVVQGNSADISSLAAVLTRGFDEEPVQQWLFPIKIYRTLASVLWFRGMLKGALEKGTIWRFEDNSSTAVWFRPGCQGEGVGFADKLFRTVVTINPRTARLKNDVDHELEVRRPQEPHWYLAAVATETRFRGQGRGKAVLRPTLLECDRRHLLAYLETSNPSSVPFYESLGFTIWSEFSVRKGPLIWCMGRRQN